jgi:hypothetical protein
VALAYIKLVGQLSAIIIIARYLCTLTPPNPHWDVEFNTFSTTVHELCGCYPFISQLLRPHIHVFQLRPCCLDKGQCGVKLMQKRIFLRFNSSGTQRCLVRQVRGSYRRFDGSLSSSSVLSSPKRILLGLQYAPSKPMNLSSPKDTSHIQKTISKPCINFCFAVR